MNATNNTPSNTISMKCSNSKCPSITAVELPYKEGTRLYRCTKCNHTRAVQVGGKSPI